jgi:hypothetical protein
LSCLRTTHSAANVQAAEASASNSALSCGRRDLKEIPLAKKVEECSDIGVGLLGRDVVVVDEPRNERFTISTGRDQRPQTSTGPIDREICGATDIERDDLALDDSPVERVSAKLWHGACCGRACSTCQGLLRFVPPSPIVPDVPCVKCSTLPMDTIVGGSYLSTSARLED